MADVGQTTAPLSYQQERMYLFEDLDYGAATNNLGFVHRIDGDLDRPALSAAVAELHRRHEILRTRYRDGASECMSTSDDYRLPFGDLSADPDPVGEVGRLIDESVNRPFDLAAEAPVRWTLYALGPRRHALTLVVHHIAFDAWSKAVVDNELSALYQAFHTGAEPAPLRTGTRYADYATRQRGRTERELHADLDEWVQAMAGAPTALRLPFDRPPRPGVGFTGHTNHAAIPEPLMRAVERLGGTVRASAFMVLLAAFAGLLAKHGGQRDMVIGVPTAGRSELDLESVVGCFVDTVPFRVRLAGLDTFADLLSHVRDVTLDTHDRPGVPLLRLVAALRPGREPGREPLVQVVFQLNNAPPSELRLTGLTVLGEGRPPAATDVELSLTVSDYHEGPVAQWQYKTELFDAGTIECLRQDYQRILERVVENPAIPLTDLLGLPARTLDFWRAELDGATSFELTPDLPRPPRRAAPALVRSFTVDPEVTTALHRLATDTDATLFMTLLAAWQTLLYRYSGVTDITLGTTAAERDMLVLRGDLDGNPGFAELLARTRDRTLAAYAHQDVPFDRLVAELGGEPDPSRTPIFQIVVTLSDEHGTDAGPARHDIELDFAHRDAGLAGEFRYDTGLYLPATIDRLVEHFTALLRAIAADPTTPIDHLGLAGPAERAAVRELTARPQIDFPNRCLHELVAEQVARTPDAIAVIDDEGEISYAELDAWANGIAGLLREHGVGPDVVVGVMLDRSVALAAALLGVLKAGGAYLPIETGTPPARVEQLLADGPAPVCLVAATHADLVTEAGSQPLVLPPIGGPAAQTTVPVHPDNLAAVYYTSGSTGRPKGVACTHAGWVNRMCWMQRHHPLRPDETVLHKTTLTFDDAAVEIFWPLMVGARVAMLAPGLHRDPRAIADAAIRHRAVHVQFVPSMLDLFLETLTDADTAGLDALRSVLSSGEALRPALVRRFRDRFGDRVTLDNTWGATEVSIDSTCRVCRPEDGAAGADRSVSIGVPIDNNEVLVLDQRLEQLPVWLTGELFIGGVGLARGYLGDPRRTAEMFLPHPYLPGQRVYRTGDWGRLGADGALTFLSRRDDQVKVRGVRVELGEVEHALRVHPSVADAAVIAWEAVPGDKRLAAYVVLRAGTTCTPKLLTEHARDLLPGYAVPGSVQIVDALPRHANGKLDRRGLPAPEVRDEHAEPRTAPRTSAERIVTEIWASVLGVERLGVNDDFFAEGGHSLLATRAIGRMRQAFTNALPLTLMFEHPTPARAAAMVEEYLLAEVADLTDEQARELLGQP